MQHRRRTVAAPGGRLRGLRRRRPGTDDHRPGDADRRHLGQRLPGRTGGAGKRARYQPPRRMARLPRRARRARLTRPDMRHGAWKAGDMTQQARPGRPRHAPASGPADATPREQILDAAAALFAERGFAATTTRLIAERVGIRQASLYYHFAGKDELLIELLTTSVRPSLDAVRRIEGLVPGSASAAAALYLLALIDVETLGRTPHNIGTLYLLPEVQHERYDSFRAERQ